MAPARLGKYRRSSNNLNQKSHCMNRMLISNTSSKYELVDDSLLCIDDEDEPRTALLLGFSRETECETPIVANGSARSGCRVRGREGEGEREGELEKEMRRMALFNNCPIHSNGIT